MDALQPAFLEIEKSADVASVVPCPCGDTKSPTVDVTPQLLDWLKADANTRKVIQELQQRQPKPDGEIAVPGALGLSRDAFPTLKNVEARFRSDE